jgi:hypothetical protein
MMTAKTQAALTAAKIALETSAPIMKHYPEPKERHAEALKLVTEALAPQPTLEDPIIELEPSGAYKDMVKIAKPYGGAQLFPADVMRDVERRCNAYAELARRLKETTDELEFVLARHVPNKDAHSLARMLCQENRKALAALDAE